MGPSTKLYFTTMVAIFRFSDVKIILTQINEYYIAKYEFDDIKNIYSHYLDPGNSQNGIISKVQSVV